MYINQSINLLINPYSPNLKFPHFYQLIIVFCIIAYNDKPKTINQNSQTENPPLLEATEPDASELKAISVDCHIFFGHLLVDSRMKLCFFINTIIHVSWFLNIDWPPACGCSMKLLFFIITIIQQQGRQQWSHQQKFLPII